jgi:hypothetical protein
MEVVPTFFVSLVLWKRLVLQASWSNESHSVENCFITDKDDQLAGAKGSRTPIILVSRIPSDHYLLDLCLANISIVRVPFDVFWSICPLAVRCKVAAPYGNLRA